jgi:hypothetical protein
MAGHVTAYSTMRHLVNAAFLIHKYKTAPFNLHKIENLLPFGCFEVILSLKILLRWDFLAATRIATGERLSLLWQLLASPGGALRYTGRNANRLLFLNLSLIPVILLAEALEIDPGDLLPS